MLIVFEGIDGCGKSTMAEMLCNKLSEKNLKVNLISYPHYESHTGKVIQEFLNGNVKFHLDQEPPNPYGIAMMYAVDHVQYFESVWKQWYTSGEIIIADRYTVSNLYYSAVSDYFKLSGTTIERFQKNIIRAEHLWIGLPYPDITFYLDTDPDECAKLRRKRSGKPDIYEKNTEFLRKVNEQGKELMGKYYFVDFKPCIINCMDEGSIRNPEDILHHILYTLKERFPRFPFRT